MTPNSSPERLKDDWLARLKDLILNIQSWAEELGWTTRRIEVTLSDS